jgi:putative FmdB family regulatory protein
LTGDGIFGRLKGRVLYGAVLWAVSSRNGVEHRAPRSRGRGHSREVAVVPIYEYQAEDPSAGCPKCRNRFEVIRGLREEPLTECPACRGRVRRLISRCRAVVIENSELSAGVERKIGEYERRGMWSHAAELADKHSERVSDPGLKTRALEDYQKAGYDADSLTKDLEPSDD